MFEGVYTALVTPFRDGALDERTLHELVEQQITPGSSALAPGGSSGEAATLSHAEHIARARGGGAAPHAVASGARRHGLQLDRRGGPLTRERRGRARTRRC